MARYQYMELEDVLDAEPYAAMQKVSRVARSKRGFVDAYIRADGIPDFLGTDRYSGEGWEERRQAFIARHLAQARRNGEPFWKDGAPTRRHLALMMWAYTPTRKRTRGWVKSL